jgi:hypothetical protein
VDDDAWFWTPQWQSMIAEAEADLLAGNVTRYASEAEFLAALGDEPVERLSKRSGWADLRGRRMTEPAAREGYEAEKRAYELGEADGA